MKMTIENDNYIYRSRRSKILIRIVFQFLENFPLYFHPQLGKTGMSQEMSASIEAQSTKSNQLTNHKLAPNW